MKEPLPLCNGFSESSCVLGPMCVLLSPNTLCCISDHMFCQKSQVEQGSKAVLCHLPFQFPFAALRRIHRLLSFILFSMSVINLLFIFRYSFLPLTPRKQPKIFSSSCKTNTLKKKAWCRTLGVQQCGNVLLARALNKPLVFHCCPWHSGFLVLTDLEILSTQGSQLLTKKVTKMKDLYSLYHIALQAISVFLKETGWDYGGWCDK